MTRRVKTPANHPVCAQPHGEFRFHLPYAAEARIEVFCGPKQGVRQDTMRRAVEIIGQQLCDWQSAGTFSWDTAKQILWGKGWNKPRTRRAIAWLVACDVLVETKHGVRITDYARNNRSRSEWAEVQALRREAKAGQKRATRLEATAKQRTQCSLEALETPLLVANSSFVSVSVNTSLNSNPNPPPKPPTLVPNGGVGHILKQDPPPQPRKPAGQVSKQAERLSHIDPVALLDNLFAKAEPTTEAHPAKLRQVFDAAPEPAQPVENDSQDYEADPWVQKMRAKSRARWGREVDDAFATEHLTPKSRPEAIKFERVPITAAELDAIADVPESQKAELLRGGYTRAEVKRVHDAAVADPGCRMPNRVLLSRLQSGQGKR